MFSISHCQNAVCLMNGVNHLPESDTKPNAMCSECLKKLSWNLKYDDVKRLKELTNFLKENHLDKDALILQKQVEAIN
jgi:archaemetzincin